MTCFKPCRIFYSYYNLCETCHRRGHFLFLMWTGLFILISISVWEDKNDECWFSSYRFHKSESYSRCVLFISSYFIKSTNHHRPHYTLRPPLVHVLEPISRISQVYEEKEQITESQADKMNKVYTRQRAIRRVGRTVNSEITLFPSFPSSPYHATWPS